MANASRLPADPVDHDEDMEGDDDAGRVEYALVTLSKAARNIPGKPGASRMFHEEHPDHPLDAHTHRHEVLVVANRVVQVAMTPQVRQALGSGLLVNVTGRREPTPEPVYVVDIIDAKNTSGAVPPDTAPSAASTATATSGGGGSSSKASSSSK